MSAIFLSYPFLTSHFRHCNVRPLFDTQNDTKNGRKNPFFFSLVPEARVLEARHSRPCPPQSPRFYYAPGPDRQQTLPPGPQFRRIPQLATASQTLRTPRCPGEGGRLHSTEGGHKNIRNTFFWCFFSSPFLFFFSAFVSMLVSFVVRCAVSMLIRGEKPKPQYRNIAGVGRF